MASPSDKLMFVYEHLSKLVTYHPLTGLMYWKNRPKFGTRRHPLKPAGSISNSGYRAISISICGKEHNVKQHNLAWFITFGKIPKEGFSIDHKNNQRSDNRLENFWREDLNKYISGIRVNGKLKHLGCFTNPLQGHTKAADFAIENGLISADEYAMLMSEWNESQGGLNV